MQIGPMLTNEAVLDELGQRLKQTRLRRNLTQRYLAEEAGVSLATVRSLEDGKPSQLVTLIRVLRVLGLLGGLERAIPEPPPSPIEELRLRGRERRRASSPRSAR
jgi:transcriptional regulator with XRE-family HTH domain